MNTKPTPQPTKGNPTKTTTQPNSKTITSIDDTIKVSAWDLEDTQCTLEGIQGEATQHIATTPANNPFGETIAVCAYDLHTVQYALNSLQTALEDIITILRLVMSDDLHDFQKQSLLRLAKSSAIDLAGVTQYQKDILNTWLIGTSYHNPLSQ